jgi:hypothetical protein
MNKFLNYFKRIPAVMFFLLILVVNVLWMSFWSLIFWGESYYSMDKEFLVRELFQQPFVAIKEEFIFRFVPFLLATIIWFVGIKIKLPKITMILVLIVSILLVQIKFGLLHCLWDQDLRLILELPANPDIWEKGEHVILQGGMGIIISFTYLKYLLHSKGALQYIQIIPLFACILLHMLSNQIVLIILN